MYKHGLLSPGVSSVDFQCRHNISELKWIGIKKSPHYLRAFDKLDPDSAVDRVKDKGWPFT